MIRVPICARVVLLGVGLDFPRQRVTSSSGAARMTTSGAYQRNDELDALVEADLREGEAGKFFRQILSYWQNFS